MQMNFMFRFGSHLQSISLYTCKFNKIWKKINNPNTCGPEHSDKEDLIYIHFLLNKLWSFNFSRNSPISSKRSNLWVYSWLVPSALQGRKLHILILFLIVLPVWIIVGMGRRRCFNPVISFLSLKNYHSVNNCDSEHLMLVRKWNIYF
jgi:hypothetical protein